MKKMNSDVPMATSKMRISCSGAHSPRTVVYHSCHDGRNPGHVTMPTATVSFMAYSRSSDACIHSIASASPPRSLMNQPGDTSALRCALDFFTFSSSFSLGELSPEDPSRCWPVSTSDLELPTLSPALAATSFSSS